MRNVVWLLMLVCLPLQALALYEGKPEAGLQDDLVHQMAHAHGHAHTHDEQGKIVVGDSAEAYEHALEYVGGHLNYAVILNDTLVPGVMALSVEVNPDLNYFVPDPDLETLRKPPR